MADPIRVLIVDDSPFMRRAVERMLSEVEGVNVVGNASDGEDALRQVKSKHPDVVIMDVNMPHMDGLEALRRIMSEAPTGVLMLSTLTSEGAETTLKALDLGAIDFLDKSAAGTTVEIYGLASQLREKVLTVAGASWKSPSGDGPFQPARVPRPSSFQTCPYDLVVIGASTGGPRALADVICMLPSDYPIGLVIAQHMPPGFTRTLADRLDRKCGIEVREAEDGSEVRPALVLIAPGGKQSRIERRNGSLVVRVEPGTPELLHRPSVDLLFGSAAETVGDRAIGVILTGMGDDGCLGLKALREAGARTLAESEQTAVIYGMPRVAAQWAERTLRLNDIGPALATLAAAGTWGKERD